MANALDELRREHANIARLLHSLDWQVDQFDKGNRPDYEVIRAAIDYFLTFPERCHHPKEDLIFARLAARSPAAAGTVGDLPAAHLELAARARELAAGLGAVLDEAEVPRAAFVRWARAFIDRQWEHLRMEEATFFPMAEKILTAADWREIDAQLAQAVDPLFGGETDVRFVRLSEMILAWQAQDEATAKG